MSREIGFDTGPVWEAAEQLLFNSSLYDNVTIAAHASIVSPGKSVYVISMATGVYRMLSEGERVLWDFFDSMGHGTMKVDLRKLFDFYSGSETAGWILNTMAAGLKMSPTMEGAE